VPLHVLAQRQLQVHGVESDDRVNHQRQAQRLLGLLVQVPPPDRALVRKTQVPPQQVQCLAFVQLPGNPSPIRLVREEAYAKP
jgi:hypothetical protein